MGLNKRRSQIDNIFPSIFKLSLHRVSLHSMNDNYIDTQLCENDSTEPIDENSNRVLAMMKEVAIFIFVGNSLYTGNRKFSWNIYGRNRFWSSKKHGNRLALHPKKEIAPDPL